MINFYFFHLCISFNLCLLIKKIWLQPICPTGPLDHSGLPAPKPPRLSQSIPSLVPSLADNRGPPILLPPPGRRTLACTRKQKQLKSSRFDLCFAPPARQAPYIYIHLPRLI